MKTDTVIKHEHLGPVDTEHPIALIAQEPFDYTQWHENLDDTINVRDLSKKAMEYQQKLL